MKKLLVILFFILAFIALSVLRLFPKIAGLNPDVLISSLINFALIVLLIRKAYGGIKPKTILWLALLGASIIPLPTHALYFTHTIFSLYSYLITLLAIIVGYFYTTIPDKYRIPTLVALFIIILLLSSFGVNLWIEYVSRPINPPCVI